MSSRAEGTNAMKFQTATLQPGEKKSSDAEALSPLETDAEIAPLVLKVGASSIAEFEKLSSELQEAKNFLQSEGERVHREIAQYTNLARTASASVKIISDSVREWREAGQTMGAVQRLPAVEKRERTALSDHEGVGDRDVGRI
jgi:prophage DNA circulation protein